MFIVMFEFVLNEEAREEEFVEAWTNTTKGIYQSFGSLGSRLHKDASDKWIAYAQWSDEETYRKAAGMQLPEEHEVHRQKMRSCLDLEATRILFEMHVESDYLQTMSFAR